MIWDSQRHRIEHAPSVFADVNRGVDRPALLRAVPAGSVVCPKSNSLANERGMGRQALLLRPSNGNNYDVLTAYNAAVARELEARGWKVVVAPASAPDFLGRVMASGADPDGIVLLGHFFYDLRVSAQNHFHEARAGDVLKGRIGAMIADHPFTNFMWPRIEGADSRIMYFVGDPAFERAAKVLNPALRRFRHLPLPNFYADSSPPSPFDGRPFDAFIAVSFRGVGDMRAFRRGLPGGIADYSFAGALYDALRHEYHRYPLDVFFELVADLLDMAPQCLMADRARLNTLLGILSQVDLIVRNDRRIELVNALLADTRGLRVQIAGILPETIGLPPDVIARGPLDAMEIGRAMAQSRIVVHCNTTFTGGMHERVLTAMSSGCVVLSDPSPALDAAFKEGEEWICVRPQQTLRDIVRAWGPSGLAAIGDRASRRSPGEFGIGHHVDALLTGLDDKDA